MRLYLRLSDFFTGFLRNKCFKHRVVSRAKFVNGNAI